MPCLACSELHRLECETQILLITLVSLIEVQDILIIFQHFSSQEALIRDRTLINFSKISRFEVIYGRSASKQGKIVVKIM